MEASQAGLAQGQQAAQNGDGEGQAQQAGPDLSSLAQSLEEMRGSQEQMREYLQSNPWQPQEAEGEPEAEPDYGTYGDDSYADPEEQAQAQRIQQFMQQQSKTAAEQAIAPLQKELTEMRQQHEAQILVDEFPQLANEDTAKEVVANARRMAEYLGHPELAENPKFWRVAFMNMSAAEAAQNEGSEDSAAAHLEGAGGAGPAAPQMDPMAIFAGDEDDGPGGRALPFG